MVPRNSAKRFRRHCCSGAADTAQLTRHEIWTWKCGELKVCFYQSARGKRRSAIEVRPDFSEAPHMRSSIPHPKADFSKNQIAPRGPRLQNVFFRNQYWHSVDCGSRNPIFQEQNSGNVLRPSYIERFEIRRKMR